MAKYEINMTKGSAFKNTWAFALPLMATSMLQLFYSAADQIVVGQWTGAHALAAIGATSSLNLLFLNLFVGISVGAGVVISRKYGAGDMYGLNKSAHSAVGISFILGIVAMIIGLVFCRPMLTLMGTPENVIDLSTLYMRILFAGAPFNLVYNFGASILRAMGDTKRPLYILSITGIINVLLNLLLVIGFGYGVAGVAIATITANFLSAVAVLYTLCYSDAPYRINFKKLSIRKEDAVEFAKIGIPSGLQGIMFNISNMVLQSCINSLGTVTMAANTAVAGVEGFVYVATNSFCQATLTGVGQNYGAKNEKRIYKVLGAGLSSSMLAGVVVISFAMIFARQLLGFYIADSPEAIEIGVARMYITTIPYFLLAIMEQFGALLNGTGRAIFSTINSFFGTCITRILWVVFVFSKIPTLTALFVCYPISWFATIVLHVMVFMLLKKKIMKPLRATEL